MQERKVPKEIHDLYMDFGELATDMELVGLPVNHEKRRVMGMMLLKEAHKNQAKLRDMLKWPDFNIYSPKHKTDLLYSGKFAQEPWNLAIRPTTFTKKTEAPSVSYKAIIDYMEHPVVSLLIKAIENFDLYARQYREEPDAEVKKLKELGLDNEAIIYGKNPKKASEYSNSIAPDGRLHCKIQPAQKGGRFSFKPNTQNQRPGDREFFEASPGRVIVGADKDQLELRIMACLAGVEELINVMREPNGDPHTYGCVKVYGREFTDKDEAYRKLIRTMFKNVVYASIYLAQPKTVHKTIRERKQLKPQLRRALTLGFVKRAVGGYFAQFPEIPEFHHRNMEKIEREGFIEVPQGWRRYFPLYPAPLNEVANWPIQCCGALTVGAEMVRIQKRLKEKYHGTAYCILHGHDAIYVECNERDVEGVKTIIDEEFGSTRLDGPKGPVYLTAGADVGKNLLTAAGYKPEEYSLFHTMKEAA
jgi:DNA polymerase I-like protein with 3'-5' exonuclease and polymerase domains